MTLFVLLALALAAATLFLLTWRPAAAMPGTGAAAAAGERPSRSLVIGLAVVLGVVTVAGYAFVGSPRLLPVTPDAPPGPGPAAEAQLDVLQRRAEANPGDADGWILAGRVQLELRHADEAARDFRSAVALRPKDPDLLADLADVLAVQAQGHLEGEPMQLVARALAIDPDHVKALALEGSFAMTQRDFRTALTAWDHALRVAQPGDPVAAYLRSELDAMRDMARRAAASASAASTAAR